MGFDSMQGKPIQIKRLAQTFLAVQGGVDKISNLKEVFEREKFYNSTFKESYLRSDSRRILLAYKIQFRLRRVIQEIREKGWNKYEYLGRARNLIRALLIQGLFNDPKLPSFCYRFGTELRDETDFKEILLDLASKKVRLILSEAMNDENYQKMIQAERYNFLRTKAFYQRCMDVASNKYGWEKQSV